MWIIEDGALSLFRGISMRIAKRSFSSALTWTIYEKLAQTFSDVLY